MEAALAAEELAEEHESKYRDRRWDLRTAYHLVFSLGGLVGLQHLYLHRWCHFLLAFLTLNMLGVGLVIDVLYLPQWVKDKNEESEQEHTQLANDMNRNGNGNGNGGGGSNHPVGGSEGPGK